MKNADIDPGMVIVVHPHRLKETAAWIVENLEPHEYPGLNQFPEDETTIVEYYTREGWEEMSWFDHYDTVKNPRLSALGHIEGERTPRRYHLVFADEQAWMMLRLLQ